MKDLGFVIVLPTQMVTQFLSESWFAQHHVPFNTRTPEVPQNTEYRNTQKTSHAKGT